MVVHTVIVKPLAVRVALFLSAALAGIVAACTPDMGPGADRGSLAAAPRTSRPGLVLSGTGFFVNDDGYLLTAAHAATGCSNLHITKDGRTLRSRLIARSRSGDLAILKIDETMGLPAVFVRSEAVVANDLVFAASYAMLQEDASRSRGMLSNAVVASADPATGLSLVSSAPEGTSGAPVINSRGLVVGIVTQRMDRTHVQATSAQSAKAFLSANGVAFAQDDQPQVGALQDRAARAATLSVGVVCFKPA